jgi:hypothetical protein
MVISRMSWQSHQPAWHRFSAQPASLYYPYKASYLTPRTPGGLVRRLCFRVLELFGRFIIAARHGRQAGDPNVDLSTTLPDLLALAKRTID